MRYKTQMQAAKQGVVTPEMALVAEKEHRDAQYILERVARGTIAIPANIGHTSLSAEGIGEGLKTKINVNLGISGDCMDYTEELKKAEMAVKMGAEAIMDLSNYGKTHDFQAGAGAKNPGDDRHGADVRCHRLSGKGSAKDHGAAILCASSKRTPRRAWTL